MVKAGFAQRGAINRPVLLVALIAASVFLAYRLFLPPSSDSAGAGGNAASGPQRDPTADASPAQARTARRGRPSSDSNIDPSLRLDLLESSRAVNYSGSARNIFDFGADAGGAASVSQGGNSAAPAPPDIETQPPPEPPQPPPVEIPLKYFGVAQLSGSQLTKALLTSGDTILIAQTGDIVAQHYRILRIGVSVLEVEDIRDHQRHEVSLAESSAAPAPAPAQ